MSVKSLNQDDPLKISTDINALDKQKLMCDEAMSLVNAGVAMQSSGDQTGAERSLVRAVEIMEQALEIEYTTAEEEEAAVRLNKKMRRYVKMINSQRSKSSAGAGGKRLSMRSNIIDFDNPTAWFKPVIHLLSNSTTYGDICSTLVSIFGFQQSNALNQKEHLVLLITNCKQQLEPTISLNENEGYENDMALLSKAITLFHNKLFNNYTKWCKYVSQSPHFSKDQLMDIVLFFLIWGEAGNFRQTPELLCFLFHKMAPIAQASTGRDIAPAPSGDFLNRVIRPMYDELKKDNDKKTSKGDRAPHTQIRNYDDFNEFFWTKKCLKYDMNTIGPAFAEVDKQGNPRVVKKTFLERRSWLRALVSFRRVFCFNFALFVATLGFAVNMTLFCPDTATLYGPQLYNIQILGKKFFNIESVNPVSANDEPDATGITSGCNLAKLQTCLGVDSFVFEPFAYELLDFQSLYKIVPFAACAGKTTGRCACYLNVIDGCFSQQGTTTMLQKGAPPITFTYDQSLCVPNWRVAARLTITGKGDGQLNCGTCQLSLASLLKTPTSPLKLLKGLIDFSRKDYGVMVMVGSFSILAIVFVCEFQNRFFSAVGIGLIGKSLPVPWHVYCKYTCFWIILFIFKALFDYEFMVKTLLETSLFIWASDPKDYLPYSKFMIQTTYHNVVYIICLWAPALVVFIYDAQIFYAIFSVIVGSIRGFNLRIGEVRSFRILRITFKSIPNMFNQKIVPNITELNGKKRKVKSKPGQELDMPVRRFERVSYSEGSKPLTVKAQKYSSLLEHREEDDSYTELKTPSGTEDDLISNTTRLSNIGSITGVSGAAFERTIPFAMAWNRCLQSLRIADVISDRELNVLSYLIDSKDIEDRRLYPPAFLTAGKLDESIDIVSECCALYDKLRTDKKKKDRTLQKIEMAMTERLVKDDLRIEAILGSYKFSSQVLRLLLGEEHKEIDDAFIFIEEMAVHHTLLKGLNLSNLYQTRAAAADLMKAILEVPRSANESSIKFQRSLYHVIDNVESVMTSLKYVLSKQENLVQTLNETPLKPNSFFFPGDAQHYASSQLQKLCNDQTAMDIVSRAYQLLTVDNFDAEPRSEEGRRRLRFFVNSLFMRMPESSAVRKMHSFSISTPYYNEIVLYSLKDLTTQNDDCIRLLFYLQTIYPSEWENLLERLNAKDGTEALKKNPEEVRLWASYRGQTLARTVRGMMYNEEAIRFLYWLEIGENEPMHLKGCNCNRCKKLDDVVALKFSYTCTCQIYGKQKDEQRQQAHDIDYLLHKHPNLRVAYVDGPKKVKDGPPKYFSVLIRSLNEKIVEIFRVELPGNPIVGEGKPENQNHAIIFTRGEYLQCIDMNQDGYLEECLKMPNLIATANNRPANRPLTIIGFREHVFTGGVSNLASFMSIQELSFVSLGQRMLALFHCRQHYGHPDLFDKIFAMTTGGTAKPSKGINLSEDIFAGFNTTLRGGQSSHAEFIQVGKGRDVGMQQLTLFEAKLSSGAGECVISRDVMRMATRLDFFRLQCWFYGNLGWYITQTMTVVAVYFFIYGKLYQALSGLDKYFLQNGGLSIGATLNTSWAFQMGMLLVIPVIAVVGVEKGFRHGITYLFWNVLTLGPVFFTFQMGTKMHYFDRTLIHGGAKYRATGRGFTIKHEKFAELFRFYASSHFYRGVELACLLILFGCYGTFSWCNCPWTLDKQYYNDVKPTEIEWNTRCYANWYQICVLPTNQNYGIITFALWIIAATWMWGPFFFNPSGLDWDKIIDDYGDWQNWLRTMNDSSESWFGWWTAELEYLEHSSTLAKCTVIIRKSRFLLLAIGIYLNMTYELYYGSANAVISKSDIMPYVHLGILFVAVLLMLCIGYASSRIAKKMTMKQRKLRKLKFFSAFFVLIVLMLSLLLKLMFINVMEVVVIVILIVYWFMQMTIVRLKHNHIVVRALARAFDRLVGWLVFGPIMFIAMFLPFLSHFQQRVMFNNAFTSGLEVSKLFANDAAPQPVVKVKRIKKK